MSILHCDDVFALVDDNSNKTTTKIMLFPPNTNTNTNFTRVNQTRPLAVSFCSTAVAACSKSLTSTCCMQRIEVLSNLAVPSSLDAATVMYEGVYARG